MRDAPISSIDDCRLNDEFIRGFTAGSHGADVSACKLPRGPLRDAWLAGYGASVRRPVRCMRLPADRRAA